MKAVTIRPGQSNLIHLVDLPKPSMQENANGRGTLVLASDTGGNRQHAIPVDKINLDFVLGNKLVMATVNANRG